MIYLELMGVFFKLGLIGFGGGYVMIPLLEAEIAMHGWLPLREFADIVAISQMTPGPIMVNAATYIGYRVGGVLGSATATFGVFLPSLLLVVITARCIQAFQESLGVQGALSGIRPATVGLIAGAVVFFARMSIFFETELFRMRGLIKVGTVPILLPAVGIFLIILIGSRRFGLKPIPAVILSAVLGLVFL